jgi:hypothetical protein
MLRPSFTPTTHRTASEQRIRLGMTVSLTLSLCIDAVSDVVSASAGGDTGERPSIGSNVAKCERGTFQSKSGATFLCDVTRQHGFPPST